MEFPPEIQAQIDAAGGYLPLLRKRELDKGYHLIIDAPWLNKEDWKECIISQVNYEQIRIVYLEAKTPWQGSFRKLIKNIMSMGILPIVVEPLEDMQKILIRWQWLYKVMQMQNDEELIFFPTINNMK